MKTLSLIFLTIVSIFSYSQELIPIGDIFAFSVGDKFHYQVAPISNPPAIDRITISDKFYSGNGDTVFYERYHDSYWTEMEWEPYPHLIYHFYTKYDTIYYHQLDSSISTYDNNFICQAWWPVCIIETYHSEDFCDSLINSYYIETSDFEGEVAEKKYGKGLGWLSDYLYSYDIYPHIVRDMKMFYYQKNGIDCGIPDTLTVSTPELVSNQFKITITPNPAQEYFIVYLKSISGPVDFKILDIYGNLIECGKWSQDLNKHSCSNYAPGVYFIQALIRNRVYCFKFIKT